MRGSRVRVVCAAITLSVCHLICIVFVLYEYKREPIQNTLCGRRSMNAFVVLCSSTQNAIQYAATGAERVRI